MRVLVGVGLLACLGACNSVLGIKDLSGGDSVDASTDGGGDAETAMARFLVLTPDVFEIDPAMPRVALYEVGGPMLVDATYGQVSPFVAIPTSLDRLEIRAPDGAVIIAAVSFDEQPGDNERVTAVVLGNLRQTDTGAIDRPRVVGFNEVLFSDSAQPIVKVVHAILDRPTQLAYSLTFAGGSTEPIEVGQLSAATAGETIATGGDVRVRLGQDVTTEPGTEETSFTLPAPAPGSKTFLILGGRQHGADGDAEPGLALYSVPLAGAATTIRQDATVFVTNFIVDHAGQSLRLLDNASGLQLSRASSETGIPMLAFVSPSTPTTLSVSGLNGPLTFGVGGLAPGTRVFVALTGYMSPTGAQPSVATATIDDVPLSPGNGETYLNLLSASPDPLLVDLNCSDASMSTTFTIGSAPFGEPLLSMVPFADEGVVIRAFPVGSATPLATFFTEVEGRRQITVMSGVQSGSPNTLRMTNLDMRAWPWAMNSPVNGQ